MPLPKDKAKRKAVAQWVKDVMNEPPESRRRIVELARKMKTSPKPPQTKH